MNDEKRKVENAANDTFPDTLKMGVKISRFRFSYHKVTCNLKGIHTYLYKPVPAYIPKLDYTCAGKRKYHEIVVRNVKNGDNDVKKNKMDQVHT